MTVTLKTSTPRKRIITNKKSNRKKLLSVLIYKYGSYKKNLIGH